MLDARNKRVLTAAALMLAALYAGGVQGERALPTTPEGSVIASIAEACGIDVDCDGAGPAEGNGLVSGEPSVDAVLLAAVELRRDADALAFNLERQLEGVRELLQLPDAVDLGAAVTGMLQLQTVDGVTGETDAVRCWAGTGSARRAALRCNPDATREPLASCETGECDCSGAAPCVSTEFECEGRCDGIVAVDDPFEPCHVLGRARSLIDAQCSAPLVRLRYQPAEGQDADALDARMRELEQRLGLLLAARHRAERAIEGRTLLAGTVVDVTQLILEESEPGEGDLRLLFAHYCALSEVDTLRALVQGSTKRLQVATDELDTLTAALGVEVQP